MPREGPLIRKLLHQLRDSLSSRNVAGPLSYWCRILTFAVGFGVLQVLPILPVPRFLYVHLSELLQVPILTAWFLVAEVYVGLGLAFGYCWIRYVERRPLSSVGVRVPSAGDLVSGALLFVIIEFVVGVILTHPLRHHPPESAIVNVSQVTSIFAGMPLSLVALGCLVSPVLEELTDRGYAICRLQEIGVSTPLAVAISVGIGTVSHIPFWGTSLMLVFGTGELLFALLFVWRRNLFAPILAHILANSYSSLIWPALPIALQAAIPKFFRRL
jgi:Type II CAAX prenyl endopeptidase Rce1-like